MAPGPAGLLALTGKLKERRYHLSQPGVRTLLQRSRLGTRSGLFAYGRHFVCQQNRPCDVLASVHI